MSFALNYAKQSQFAGCSNERKVFCNNGLWLFSRFETAEKQTQNKAKQSQFEPISRPHVPDNTERLPYCTGGRQHAAKILIGWLTTQSLICSICILQAAHSVRTFLVGDFFRASFRLAAICEERSKFFFCIPNVPAKPQQPALRSVTLTPQSSPKSLMLAPSSPTAHKWHGK